MEQIESRLAPCRRALRDHRIYNAMDRLESLCVFMEHHVFAVWDFMSLLKALQRRICCTEVPWLPPGDPEGSRFINDIVLAEESDEDGQGGFASHFELYRRSMIQSGASTRAIDGFLGALRQGAGVAEALSSAAAPPAAARFVNSTFDVIQRGDLCEIASVFAFGREDLLPQVFQQIVDNLDKLSGGKLAHFGYYLQRHIELDGEDHGPMATRLLKSLCGDDGANWDKAGNAAVDCLIARNGLWDGICEAINRAAVPGKDIRVG